MKTFFLLALMYVASQTMAFAQSCSKHSPAYQIALLELYTSEGCSSCPPADRSFSALRNGMGMGMAGWPGLDQVVPLALHVDYWDYIGWKDVFASPAYTARQRWLSDQTGKRAVYTPEMFIGGQELRNWHSDIPAAVRRINSQPSGANINIMLGKVVAGSVSVGVNAQAAQGGKLFVALYENDLTSRIRAGENDGVTLHHDYVVRQWIGPIAIQPGANAGKTGLQRVLILPTGSLGKNLGIAAFVEGDKGVVLQALALPFCGT